MRVKLVLVGRPRSPLWRPVIEDYLGRAGRLFNLELVQVKDAGKASPEEGLKREAAAVLCALSPRDRVALLDERGKLYDSKGFATLIAGLAEDANVTPCFVVGGAFGVAESIRNKAVRTLSLSPMTLPHEAAAAFFAEQLYRAGTILKGLPYHHA